MRDEIDASRTTVLVVDDSLTYRTLVTRLLAVERPNWIVLETSTAAEGLEILASQNVTVVVVEFFMPEMPDEPFITEVGRRFPGVPVILITAPGSDKIAAKSLELGAVNYVPKRRLADDLVPAVDDVLRGVRESTLTREVVSHIVRSQTNFRIESDLEQIEALLHLIRERLETLRSLTDNEVQQVTDAVREALMNAHIHGSQTRSGTFESDGSVDSAESGAVAQLMIKVELSISKERLCVVVTDQGAGFDTSTVDESKLRNGFRIMRRNMDRIEFNSSGNRIGLTKELITPGAV
ncbi:MAG: response regulator [Fuerstiella sp.]|nr:response regulator [Fuerstiella sp.]